MELKLDSIIFQLGSFSYSFLLWPSQQLCSDASFRMNYELARATKVKEVSTVQWNYFMLLHRLVALMRAQGNATQATNTYKYNVIFI